MVWSHNDNDRIVLLKNLVTITAELLRTQRLPSDKGTLSTIELGAVRHDVELGICFSNQYSKIPDAVSCITLKRWWSSITS